MKAPNPMTVIRDFVRDGIARGELSPGQKLPPERELAERFHTSRAAVRQAMTVLETERWVHRHIGRGTFIAHTAGEFATAERASAAGVSWNGSVGSNMDTSPAKLMEARLVLEPQIAEFVVSNATESDLARLSQLCESQQALVDAEEFEDSDIRFHRALAEATNNDVLVATSELIISARHNPEWHKLKQASRVRNRGRRVDVPSEHRAIVEALRARDATAACLAMRNHLLNIRTNLLGY